MTHQPAHPSALWLAGGKLCCCCAKPTPEPGTPGVLYNQRGTVEHVIPKSPKPADLARAAAMARIIGGQRRKAIAHSKCNQRKGNRLPTGCELVFLMAVNARMGCGFRRPTSDNARTIDRRNRRQVARKAADLQERLFADVAACAAKRARQLQEDMA